MFIDKYDAYYAPLIKHNRAGTFRQIFEYLIKQNKSEYYILETGTSRNIDPNYLYNDGGSTFMLDEFISSTDGQFISIDINEKNKILCESRMLSARTKLLTGDSIKTIYDIVQQNIIPRIDFLYLDSYDIDWNNPHPSSMHHMKELLSAMPKLVTGSLIAIDDNSHGIGKGQYVAEYMSNIQKNVLFNEYQIGWVW